MCMQCVAAGATYLVPTVAALQVYKVKARKKRLATPKPRVPAS